MDGVLFDTNKLVSDYFLYTYPTATKADWDNALMGNFHESLEKIERIHKHVEETNEEEMIRRQRYAKDKSSSKLFPGIFNLLTNLHNSGHILVINTSALESNCLPLLEYSDVFKFFDFIATADVSKSKVEKFKIIENKYKVDRNNLLFITDTVGDILEAELAGISTIAVTWGAHDKSYFKPELYKNLIATFDSVDELEKFIKDW